MVKDKKDKKEKEVIKKVAAPKYTEAEVAEEYKEGKQI